MSPILDGIGCRTCLYCLTVCVIHDISSKTNYLLITKAPRHLLQHYDLTAAQKLVNVALQAIEATVIEQAQRHPKFDRRHLTLLMTAKQANELHPWFTRQDLMKLIKLQHLPIPHTIDNLSNLLSLLVGGDMINSLKVSRRAFSPDTFKVTRYGESILRRLSHHHNTILRSMDSRAKRREVLQTPFKKE